MGVASGSLSSKSSVASIGCFNIPARICCATVSWGLSGVVLSTSMSCTVGVSRRSLQGPRPEIWDARGVGEYVGKGKDSYRRSGRDKSRGANT